MVLRALVLALALLAAHPAGASPKARPRARSQKSGAIWPKVPTPVAKPAPIDEAAALRELPGLARAVHNATPGSYAKLASYATKNAGTVWGARAALALGYADYSNNRAQQALTWLERAKPDALLREYMLYWNAQAKLALHRTKDAYADLQIMQREYPRTAMREQLLDALSDAAVEIGKPKEALDALETYPSVSSKTNLLLNRAAAFQSARQLARAAADYQAIFFKFPLSDEAKPAQAALAKLARAMRSEYPLPTAEMQRARAQAFFDARKWREARAEFEKLRALFPRDSANPLRQRAELRIAQSRVQLKGSPSLIASVAITDPEIDADRLYVLSQAWRTEKDEARMLATIEQLLLQYAGSRWAEDALMAKANYYWVQLDRARAAQYYKQLLETYPGGRNAQSAEWRIAWVRYIERKPESDELIQNFLAKYPVTGYTTNALYWLGRNAEREGNPERARAYYAKNVERFPQTYFSAAAAIRLAQLGPGDTAPVALLDSILAPPVLRAPDEAVPNSVKDRWERAEALRAIAFDASAEQELRTAYFATGSPRLLLEAAYAAFDQGHYAAGMSYARLVIPNFDSRKISDAPLAAWKALYPLPYEATLRREAAKNGLDPMLVAGLIRQESTFQADAVSHADAVGLMQVLPKTGKLLAKQLHLRFAKKKLTDPEYNIALGTLYLAGLIKLTGGPEQALAAYNAGEDRIALWSAERQYDGVAELVESIPFSETREYVQIVLRNADSYRMIYGLAGPAANTQSPGGR